METATQPPEAVAPPAAQTKARPAPPSEPEFEPIGLARRSVDPRKLSEVAELNLPLVPITVAQYHRMLEAGIILEGAPIELLNGLLVRKNRAARGEDPMTIGGFHALVIEKLTALDGKLHPSGCRIRIQLPLTLSPDSEPEPDGAIVRGAIPGTTPAHPAPPDVLCVIEAADSSLQQDREDKQRLYGGAGIPQYLIINIPDRQIEVHEHPLVGQGRYGQVAIVKPGQNVALLVGTDKRLEVPGAELLP